MTIVSPSLLSCDFLNIESEVRSFENINDIWFHLDIMDGHFVPNLTFGHPIVRRISKITNQKLDAHFMVKNPEFYVETFKDYNIHNFTFHLESTDRPLELINNAKIFYPNVGISIKPKTEVSELSSDILKAVDLILVMSVEPGFGGQAFMPNSINKIKELSKIRNRYKYTYSIQVDGGVSNKNAKTLVDAGADNLVAGSYIFKAGKENYLNQIESLRNFKE